METLESSRVCRLCGKKSGISINLFDKNENHVRKINAVLPIMVHEMDLLPKHMCHRCSYKLEEFHRFYVDCLKTDANLKSQLSWMKKKDSKEKAGVPMVQIENVKIKVEPPDCNDVYRLEPIVDNVNYINAMKSMTFPINRVGTDEIRNGITYAAYARCNCYCDKKDQSKERNVSNQYRKPVVGFERNDKRLSAASTILEKSTRFSSSEDIVERHRLLETRNYACPKNMGKKSSLSAQSKGIELSFFKKKLLFDCKIQDRNDTIDDASKSTIVRNLRPRKHFVNYLDWKRKAPSDVSLLRLEGKSEDMNEKTYFSPLVKSDTVRIKTEEREEFGGRTLRPRKRIIDYLETKRKNNPVVARDRDKYRSTEIGTRTYDNVSGNNNVCESRLRTVQEVRTIVEDDIKLGIKQEIFTNLDKILLKKSTTTTHRVLETNKKDALPDNAIDRVNTRLTNYAKSNCIQNRSNFQLGDNNNDSKDRESNNNNNNNNNNNREDALNHSSCVKRIPAKRLKYNNNYNNKLRSLKDIKKSKFNCNKASAKRIIAPIYSNLRSMCIQLRNGKVKRFEDPQTSVRRLKKKIRCVTVKSRSIGRNLLNVINKTVGAKKVSTSVKLNEDAIKHYCEKCSLSFVNKEMFKLHVCYQ